MSLSRWSEVYTERAREFANPLDVCEFYSGDQHYSQEWFQETAARIGESLCLEPQDRVLEVGCGCAIIMKYLLPRAKEFVGVDLSAGVLDLARQSLPHVSFQLASAADLPFADAAFDKCYCYQAFHYFDEFAVARQAVDEMRRVVRPGGRILIGQVPNVDFEAEYQQARRSRTFHREQRVQHDLRWLWYSPRFFDEFRDRFTTVEIRRLASDTDLASKYRMDVLLTV